MMDLQAEPYGTLSALEVSLWRAETRGDRALMDATFADDFFEFGRSGRVWSRDELLFNGCPPIEVRLPLSNLRLTMLNDATALITYDSIVQYETLQHAHRSSIWSLIDGRWKLRFHQGTPFTPATDQGA